MLLVSQMPSLVRFLISDFPSLPLVYTNLTEAETDLLCYSEAVDGGGGNPSWAGWMP